MRLPITVKALKFMFAGYSFGVARQLVADRRLAKAIVNAPGGGKVAGQHQALAVSQKDLVWAQRVQGVSAELARRAAARAPARPPEPKRPPQPKLVRSGSDPNVGAAIPMFLRAEHAEV